MADSGCGVYSTLGRQKGDQRKMSGNQVVLTVSILAVLTAGCFAWDAHLQARIERKELEVKLRQLDADIRFQEMLREIAGANVSLHALAEN